MFTWLVVALEGLGIRCSKCGSWWTPMMDIEEKLDWGTNVGDILFTDPFYVNVTTCHCAQCNHLMFEKRKLSNKKEEVEK